MLRFQLYTETLRSSRIGSASIIIIGASLSGCVSQPNVPNIAAQEQFKANVERMKAASAQSATPANISTVDFKELGETRRNAIMGRVIRETWNEDCKPAFILPNGYSPNGDSQWKVTCDRAIVGFNYIVTLPERANGNAHVLKCTQSIGVTRCSIVNQSTPPVPPVTNAAS